MLFCYISQNLNPAVNLTLTDCDSLRMLHQGLNSQDKPVQSNELDLGGMFKDLKIAQEDNNQNKYTSSKHVQSIKNLVCFLIGVKLCATLSSYRSPLCSSSVVG